jgi:lipopolysaccharide export system permease protein
MGTVQQYVAAEVLRAFLVAATAATMLMTLAGAAQEGLRQGLPVELIATVMPYVLPEMLRYTIPGCLLFAVCSVFGRIAASNELTALKALGIPPWSVVWPVLMLSFILSLAAYSMYDLCAIWGRPNLRRSVIAAVDEIAYGVLRTEKSFAAGGLSINVKSVEDRTLIKPMIVVALDENKPPVSLRCEEARLESDIDAGLIRIHCRNGQIEAPGKGRIVFQDSFEQAAPFHQPLEADPNTLTPANLSLPQINEQIQREELWLAAKIDPDLPREPSDIEWHRKRLLRLQAEPERRRSNGFSCLAFALVGMGVALSMRAADNVTVFFVCFLPILLVYYPCLVIGEYLALEGYAPPPVVWTPNLILALGGMYALSRVAAQ